MAELRARQQGRDAPPAPPRRPPCIEMPSVASSNKPSDANHAPRSSLSPSYFIMKPRAARNRSGSSFGLIVVWRLWGPRCRTSFARYQVGCPSSSHWTSTFIPGLKSAVSRVASSVEEPRAAAATTSGKGVLHSGQRVPGQHRRARRAAVVRRSRHAGRVELVRARRREGLSSRIGARQMATGLGAAAHHHMPSSKRRRRGLAASAWRRGGGGARRRPTSPRSSDDGRGTKRGPAAAGPRIGAPSTGNVVCSATRRPRRSPGSPADPAASARQYGSAMAAVVAQHAAALQSAWTSRRQTAQ